MKYEHTMMDPKVRYYWVGLLSRQTVNDMIRRHVMNLRDMRQICRVGVKMQYPQWDDSQVKAEVEKRAAGLDFLTSFNEYFRYERELEAEVLGPNAASVMVKRPT